MQAQLVWVGWDRNCGLTVAEVSDDCWCDSDLLGQGLSEAARKEESENFQGVYREVNLR